MPCTEKPTCLEDAADEFRCVEVEEGGGGGGVRATFRTKHGVWDFSKIEFFENLKNVSFLFVLFFFSCLL